MLGKQKPALCLSESKINDTAGLEDIASEGLCGLLFGDARKVCRGKSRERVVAVVDAIERQRDLVFGVDNYLAFIEPI